MLRTFGPSNVEGYVASLERTAAARMSYADSSELSLDWMGAASRNGMDLATVMDLAMACNSSF
ncbi:hypothetical protein [Thalassorhabdomicrobium marinisediminis]|uniref:Uncharacterized protein n=2 Tax=Thalassorhabdomicrobium marinisediminis TaxID=2170577 RepID=A0A2T7FYA8_9RHOB|nr:hypothetical protein [Thalassorhabdomicrobium marinisediminis]PVA07151.1 hypothetical protein DC363_04660 [Thalassorhabdomicrobium marinisediminis]